MIQFELMNHFKNQDEALSDGANLWIIADLAHSGWAKKLDWYLNFQLRRASLHKSKKISERAQEKIANWGFDLEKLTKSAKSFDREKASLMIASHRLLPNRLTVQIPFIENSTSNWVQECVKVLRDLKQSQVRIFLPQNVSRAEFTKAASLKSSDGNFSFELVEESSID